MLIKQLSIFLENKKGRFTEVAKILGEAGVNMSAFTVAENSDFGILRLIVSDTEKAISVLREKLYAVSVADVVCLHCPNQPGALAKAMESFLEDGALAACMGKEGRAIAETELDARKAADDVRLQPV